MSRPGKTSSRCCENSASTDITSSKCPCFGQSFTIRILPSRSMIVAFTLPTFSLFSTSTGSLPSRISWRISATHRGHSESVERGQPSGGFDFSYDFSSGLSDHLGVGDGLGLIRLKRSKKNHAPLAVMVTAFSTYLIGLCISSRSPQIWDMRRSSAVSLCFPMNRKTQLLLLAQFSQRLKHLMTFTWSEGPTRPFPWSSLTLCY